MKKHDTKLIPRMPEVTHHANLLETPPQRIFAELDGISKYQKRDKFKDRGPVNDVERSMTVSEDKVVNAINQYRRGLDVNDFKKNRQRKKH